MGVAFIIAAGSSGRQQGAVIVGPTLTDAIGMDHDGSPRGLPEGEHVIHAEINALFNCPELPHGSTLYVTHTPCYNCVLAALAANVKRIVYFHTKDPDGNSVDACRQGYASLEKFEGNLNWMRDHFKGLASQGVFD